MGGACEVRVFRRSHHIYKSDSNYLTRRRVEKSENEIKYVWNELKPLGAGAGGL
jgi:hypothetical protein